MLTCSGKLGCGMNEPVHGNLYAEVEKEGTIEELWLQVAQVKCQCIPSGADVGFHYFSL